MVETAFVVGVCVTYSQDTSATNGNFTAADLRCEYLVNPLGIDVTKPRLSWILESTERGQKQTAYQIIVASSEEKLKANKPDLWDTGKVKTDQSIHVVYKGKSLVSAMRCFWKVRVWDEEGNVSAWGRAARWEMGLLETGNWQGQWTGAERSISAPLFRKEFAVGSDIKKARVYVSGLGYYELYINGRKVGDHVLDPANTTYHDDLPFKVNPRVLYVTYDVTDYLKTGNNVVGAMLGNGWYSPDEPGVYRLGKKMGEKQYSKAIAPFGDRPKLLLQMNIETADGKEVSVVSDKTWKTSSGPITANNICDGEAYDGRLEKAGWENTGYDDSGWDNSRLVDAPNGVLRAQMIPPVKVCRNIKAVKLFEPKEGVFVFDFGQHFSGWMRLRVAGDRGTKVTLRYAGRVYEDNMIDDRNATTSWLSAAQTDTYTLKGAGIEEWEPRFTLHGFRYVELTGFPGKPSMETLEGRFVHSDIEVSGSFECSNPLLNQIHHNVWWTFMSSFQGISQDAGDRCERVGCTGAPGFVGEDYLYNFYSAAFWAKWVNDMRDSQKPNGNLSVITPLDWPGRNNYQVWPAWASNYHLFIWYLYQYYGDTRIIEEHYDGMKKYVDFLGTKTDDYVIHEGMGDHMEPQPGGESSFDPKATPRALPATGYYYFDARILAESAKILGKDGDVKYYSELAEKIKQAYNKEFFDPETNQYAGGTQTANAFSLYLGMVPDDREQAVLENLIDNIVNEHDGHLWAGIIGINALEQVLADYGYADVMYGIATKTTWPSWGYQIANGATTVWERFEVSSSCSLNMKMLGSVEKFFYKDIAGIAHTLPGYADIAIKPYIVGDLTHAKASVKTVRGIVSSQWQKDGKTLRLDVRIPVNSRAKVSVPKVGLTDVTVREGGNNVWEDGEFVAGITGIASGSESQVYVTFDVGSGLYEFTLTGHVYKTADGCEIKADVYGGAGDGKLHPTAISIHG